jgi:hypothetical protein
VSDEFTVPLCALHHQELHHYGNEVGWWSKRNLDPLPIAETLWRQTKSGEAHLIVEERTSAAERSVQ